MDLIEDIRSVTDLKRHTREILDHVHKTGRPTILTVNGRADAVLMDVDTYQKNLQAATLARLLSPAEAEVAKRLTRPAVEFIEEFQRERQVQG